MKISMLFEFYYFFWLFLVRKRYEWGWWVFLVVKSLCCEIIEIEGLLNFDACNYYYDLLLSVSSVSSFNQIFMSRYYHLRTSSSSLLSFHSPSTVVWVVWILCIDLMDSTRRRKKVLSAEISVNIIKIVQTIISAIS